MRMFTAMLGLTVLLGSSVIAAGVPNTINYQGRLTDAAGDAVPDGAILVKFQIYDAATGGTVFWNSLFQTINTVDGLFSYDLGSNVALPDLFGTDSVRYLGITVGTDPEISPRSRFTSSGYVFRSLKSDLALDADSLGGLQPAFYLEWANLTSIPAGFADGVDDEGMDQATADGRYVNLSGDFMMGDLHVMNSSRLLTRSILYSDYGELDIYHQNQMGFAALAAHSSGGLLVLSDTSGDATIVLQGQLEGDGSVVIPDDAINSNEILDEPGIAFQGTGALNLTTTMQDMETVTITIPTAGYIYVTGSCWLRQDHDATALLLHSAIQIDETVGGPYSSSYAVFNAWSVPNASIVWSVYVDRVYFKSAGTYSFRMEGMTFSGSGGSFNAGGAHLSALFFPTAYGSVTAVAEQPGEHPNATRVEMVGPDGAVSVGYDMDLRYYEEKARAARIAEQKAELAEAEAKLELIRARGASDKE